MLTKFPTSWPFLIQHTTEDNHRYTGHKQHPRMMGSSASNDSGDSESNDSERDVEETVAVKLDLDTGYAAVDPRSVYHRVLFSPNTLLQIAAFVGHAADAPMRFVSKRMRTAIRTAGVIRRQRGRAFMKKDSEDRAMYGSSLALLLWATDALAMPLDSAICAAAAAAGDLAALQYLREKGVPWMASTCAAAARAGHMHILQYARSAPLHSKVYDADNNVPTFEGAPGVGCRWDEQACRGAVQGGHLEVLQWLRGAAPPCPWYSSELCDIAAAVGSLPLLQYLRDNGCSWSTETTRVAAQFGHLNLLRYMVLSPNHLQFDKTLCASAAFEGHLHILQFARSKEVDSKAVWDESTCAWAAQSGKLEVLRWMRGVSEVDGNILPEAEICPWDYMTTYTAAVMGHLEVLKFARSCENGAVPCPWATSVYADAEERGHDHVCRWIRAQEDPGLSIERERE